jgi:hypothetical protein
VGTTKCSEQNHNPKEKGFKLKEYSHKGFKLKEYSRLKSHESLSEFDYKTGNHVRAGLAAYRRGRLGITLPAHYDCRPYNPPFLKGLRPIGLSSFSVMIFSRWDRPGQSAQGSLSATLPPGELPPQLG